jgi:2-iminobutanoate/2-iminopropanoate deaminase
LTLVTLETLHTDHAPAAIGPYAQAVKANGFLFTAGQIPLHPETMTVVGTTVAEQTGQVVANLRAVLAAAGCDFSHVVKTTVFLRDMADFTAMNEVYAEAFGSAKPARSTVAVAGLPKDVRVEIELVAVLG